MKNFPLANCKLLLGVLYTYATALVVIVFFKVGSHTLKDSAANINPESAGEGACQIFDPMEQNCQQTIGAARTLCKCVIKQTEVRGRIIIYVNPECPIHGHYHNAQLSESRP